MKTVIIRNYEKFHDRVTDTKFEPRAVNVDDSGAGFMGCASVEDSVAAEHYVGRHGYLVFEDPMIMAGTARNPANVSTADALTREPTDAELDHAEECRIEAERAAAVREGATVDAKPSKPTRKQAAEAKAKADAEAERAAVEAAAEAEAKAKAEAQLTGK